MRLTKVITLLNKRQVRFCKILKTTSSVLDDHNITHTILISIMVMVEMICPGVSAGSTPKKQTVFI